MAKAKKPVEETYEPMGEMQEECEMMEEMVGNILADLKDLKEGLKDFQKSLKKKKL